MEKKVPEVVQAELPLVGVAPPVSPKRFELPTEVVDKPASPEVAPAPKVTNTVDSAPTTEPEVKPEPEVTPELAAKRAKNEERRRQNQLEKAYRTRAEAQARADLLERRLAQLESAQAPKPVEGEPRLEQFEYDPEKYATAKAEFATTQAAKANETRQREEFQKQSYQKLLSSWEEKAERGADKYDDWNEKVGNLQPNSYLTVAISEAENGHDIAHYLGTNLKEAVRIAQLPPVSQVREIGKLEARLLSKPVEPKVPSKAPAPITPLSGSSSGSGRSLEEADMGEFIKMRQKKLYGKR